MVNEAEARDTPGGAEALGSAFAADPLSGSRSAKRWTRIGVYLAILGYGPLYLFVFGYELRQVFTSWTVGLIIATVATELAFWQVFKLRKRGAYPGVLLVELGSGHHLNSAAQHCLVVIRRLMATRAAFLALCNGDDEFDLMSVSGMGREVAQRLLQAGVREVREAMRSQQPVPFKLPGGWSAESGVSRKERLVLVPVVALEQPIGVLAVVGRRRNADLRDDQLLSSVGVALGLSLESLRQGKEIRESEERLHTVIASTPIVMFALDREGIFLLGEGSGLDTLGFHPSHVLGRSIFDHCRDMPQVLESVRRALAGESFTTTLDVNGRVLEAWLSPVKDHSDEIDGMTGVVTDITERVRAEEALRESEGKFRTLAETISAAAFIFQGTRLRYVNSASEELTGYSREELLEMNFWDVMHPDFRDEVKARGLARQRGEPVPTRYEAKLLTKNGDECWVDFTVGVVEFEGSPAVMGTGFDITERKRAEDALRRSEERYRLLADNATDMIWTRDLSLRPTYTSPSVTRLRGHTVEEAMAQTLEEVLTPDSLQLARMTLAEELAKESAEDKDLTRTRTLELEMYRKDGSTIWTEMTVNFLRDGEDRPTGLLGVTRDISERKRTEQALQESETKFRTLAETVAAAAFIYQGKRIRYVNSAAEALTGYTREEMLEMDFWDVIAPDFRGLARERGLARQKGQHVPVRYEVKLMTKDGDERWVDFTAGKVEFDGKPAVLGTAFDVTERKEAEETIKHLAYHDALTDLPNRTLFKDRLTQAVAQARRKRRMVAVLFLDLDHFKVVNDTVGHGEGDNLLGRVSERLTGLVREADTVARVGGDEFALLSSEITHAEDAAEVAERVLEGLRRPWVLRGQEFLVSASVGIAVYPGDGDDAETLLRNADTAMYRAKEHGRDNYRLYTPAMNARIVERLALESSLRRGLELGEFMVYYQPQVNIRTGQVVGAEALVRWQHPERGLVLPAEFIPVAEETGLIVPLGEWVLRTACAQNKAWQEAGLPLMRVAVNLSARQFQQRSLTDTVAQVLQETGLDARWLQLEITEGIAMQDADFTNAMLRGLREMGVQIAIDDFGTGYSSLAYLKRFPIDAVKIDRSFVRDLTIDPNDAAIATTVITMAHSLKLSVIAEGVETEEQLTFLKQRKCDEMQGFLFSKPVPVEVLEKTLRTNGRRARARTAVDST